MTNKIDFTQWKKWNWESANRYYSLLLDQDLFGQWTVTRKWGGKFTKIHRYQKEYCDIDQIDSLFIQINKRRVSRGYTLLT